MGNFDLAGREKLLRKWSSLIDEDGKIVTIQRVRPENSPTVVRFSVEQARTFVFASLEAAELVGINQRDELDIVKEAATVFASRFQSHAITSKVELEKLFKDAGLCFQYLEYKTLEQTGELSGPSVPSGGDYALIIAGRELKR